MKIIQMTAYFATSEAYQKRQSVPVCLLLVFWYRADENVRPVRCIQKLVFQTPWPNPQISHSNESENHHIL